MQQTDRSIARYHLPILLFDYTAGSRAAFAAYWLSRMGFCVKIAIVDADHLQFNSRKNTDVQEKSDQQLIEKWVSDGTQFMILGYLLNLHQAISNTATGEILA